MDLILELLAEIFIDGAAELADSEKCPRVVRYIIVFILTVLYAGLAVLCVWGIIQCEEWILKTVLAVGGFLCIFFAGRLWWKLLTR